MTRRRWIADESSAHRAALTGAHADHLIRVLRAEVGQEFDIATAGAVRRARITAIHDHRVEFDLGDEVGAARPLEITLALAVFKFDRMEWAIEKGTELGVSRIVPLIAQRSDAHLASASASRVERWRRIARQASEQSRRISPPEIAQPLELRAAVTLEGATRIVSAESEEQLSLKQALESHSAEAGVIVAVGPEGGWTPAELKLFQQSGWMSASLGDTILRAETAAIAAIAVISSELY